MLLGLRLRKVVRAASHRWRHASICALGKLRLQRLIRKLAILKIVRRFRPTTARRCAMAIRGIKHKIAKLLVLQPLEQPRLRIPP